jgi:hypothetical protein
MIDQAKQTTHLIVKNRVADFTHWKKGFDAHLPERTAAGLHEIAIFQNLTCLEDFFLIFEISNPLKAQEFISSVELKDLKNNLGITSAPEYHFVTEIKLNIKQIHSQHLDLIKSALKAVDQMDAKVFAHYFSEYGEFQFANHPSVLGLMAIENSVQNFFSTIHSLSHEIATIHDGENSTTIRGHVTYTKKDQSRVKIPFSNYFEFDSNSKFQKWQIFIDLEPLFS